MNLGENTLDGGESSAKCAVIQDEVDFGNRQTSGFALKTVRNFCILECIFYLENIATEIIRVLDFENNLLSLWRDGCARLDFVISITAVLAVC